MPIGPTARPISLTTRIALAVCGTAVRQAESWWRFLGGFRIARDPSWPLSTTVYRLLCARDCVLWLFQCNHAQYKEIMGPGFGPIRAYLPTVTGAAGDHVHHPQSLCLVTTAKPSRSRPVSGQTDRFTLLKNATRVR